MGTIRPCGEHNTLRVLSANFDGWRCDSACVLPCVPVVHLLASFTPSSTSFHQDRLRYIEPGSSSKCIFFRSYCYRLILPHRTEPWVRDHLRYVRT